MGNNTDTNAPSIAITTITTTDSGNGLATDSRNGLATVTAMLQSELNRKLADLKDIHAAYKWIHAYWTESRPEASPQYCYAVVHCWSHSEKMWQYQHRLEDAATKTESEIAQLRKEMLDALVNSHRSGLAPASYSE
ncbi:hypothetical protein EC957_011066 [Mortierella hygrophila]|uniref:Uncharacterized protein n=1 Tax=Mortierella hygrophila TaxID=979708 RepID=A0A9P6F9Z0_9FUNG|nr:hypothetical protein EC957_011066 [Mortierella hygrophila]